MNVRKVNPGDLKSVYILFLMILVTGFVLSCRDTEEKEKVYYPEDFTIHEGIEIYRPSQWNTNRFLRLLPGEENGLVSRHYFGQSARYIFSLTGTGTGPGSGSLTVQLLVNSQLAGSFEFVPDSADPEAVPGRMVIELPDIDIAQYSEINLRFSATNGQTWAIDRLTLKPAGKYKGERVSLPRPNTLRVYNTIEEQHAGHSMVQRFVRENAENRIAQRDSVLTGLDTPGEWRAYQKKVRDNLSSILGSFPDRTPLNPRIVGRIDYPDYYIEQIIYESQPDFFVPANLYIPKNRDFPVPGVLYTIGHWDMGKMAPDIHRIGVGFAKKGYFAIVVDPVGQGERSEYFDPGTLEPTVGIGVAQHHYVNRPASLVDWSLPGLRAWDYIRAVDYLVSRPEVDTSRLAVAGNSGGGQMALVTAAADSRIKVVAAAHPGGSCERAYLTGRELASHDILSLVAPRPCRMIVGDASGEAPHHGRKLDDMARFYRGLGVDEDHWDMDIVDARHDNTKPVRESTYEWLNLWFDKTGEGKEEPPVEDEDAETLQCTESGVVLASLGGETGQTLNLKRGEQLYNQAQNLEELKERISNRVKLNVQDTKRPEVRFNESFMRDDISVEKFVYVSEKDIEIPALLLRPVNQGGKQQVILHVSENGKPESLDVSSLPATLVQAGYTVLSIDVRGTGETASHPPVGELDMFAGYTSEQWIRDLAALEATSFERTMLGMQALDVLKGIDLITGRNDLKGKPVIVAGEGLGGLLALLGGIYRPEISAVITVNTLPSYKLLLSSRYYNQLGYFYVPGALKDYDIPDLGRLVSPGRLLWIDPCSALSERMAAEDLPGILGKIDGLRVILTADGHADEISYEILDFLEKNRSLWASGTCLGTLSGREWPGMPKMRKMPGRR
jgi:cephalosporin-C deacetylase-like acetyl esterase